MLCLAHIKPPSTGPDNSKESPSGWVLRFDEVLSFKASTCLAPGDCRVLIPVLAQSFCGPGQVTSSSEEGIHQVPRGLAEAAAGCKTILGSKRGWRGPSAVRGQLRAVAQSCWCGDTAPGGHCARAASSGRLFRGLGWLVLAPA